MVAYDLNDFDRNQTPSILPLCCGFYNHVQLCGYSGATEEEDYRPTPQPFKAWQLQYMLMWLIKQTPFGRSAL